MQQLNCKKTCKIRNSHSRIAKDSFFWHVTPCPCTSSHNMNC